MNEAFENNLVVSKLAMERCRNHLAHIHAIMYMCEPRDLGLHDTAAESVRQIIDIVDRELETSYMALDFGLGEVDATPDTPERSSAPPLTSKNNIVSLTEIREK